MRHGPASFGGSTGSPITLLRDPHDAKTLATMIHTLYQKAEWRSRIGQAAAKASLDWTWDRNAAEIRQLLSSVVGKKRQHPAKQQSGHPRFNGLEAALPLLCVSLAA